MRRLRGNAHRVCRCYSRATALTFRPMKRAFVASLLTALSMSCASCTAPVTPPVQALGKVTINVEPLIRPTRAKVKLGYELTIILPPAEPAGNVWQIAQHNPATLVQRSEIHAGAAGLPSVSFLVRRTGATRVLFTLVPVAGASEVQPVDVRDV